MFNFSTEASKSVYYFWHLRKYLTFSLKGNLSVDQFTGQQYTKYGLNIFFFYKLHLTDKDRPTSVSQSNTTVNNFSSWFYL